MTLQEFNNLYCMHDSNIDETEYDKESATVNLRVDFAFWMQDWYLPGSPEIGSIKLKFRGVTFFSFPENADLSRCGILGTKFKDGILTFTLTDLFTDEIYQASISAESVETA